MSEMRVLFMGNNWVAWQVASWLNAQGSQMCGLVLHPPHKRTFGEFNPGN